MLPIRTGAALPTRRAHVGPRAPLRRRCRKRVLPPSLREQMNMKSLPLVMLLLGTGACASGTPSGREMYRQLDLNGDGAIQFSEIQVARANLFDRLDVNRDGFLDAEEIRLAAQRAGNRRDMAMASADDLAQLLSRMDTDGDGRISRQEFSGFIPDRVRRADANGDGVLSRSELRAMRRQ